MNAKWKAVALLMVIFILGIVSGMMWQRHRYQQWPKQGAHFPEKRLQRMKKNLELTPTQETAIRTIFQKAHDQTLRVNEQVSWDLAAIHRESVAAIRQVLTPDQLIKFEPMHQRYHDHHKDLPADTESRPVPLVKN